MNRIRRVELPEEMMPDERLKENAKKIDEEYVNMYNHLRDCMDDINATEMIALMAQFFVERLALLVGENLNEYDKSILRGVLERHIAEVVFVE